MATCTQCKGGDVVATIAAATLAVAASSFVAGAKSDLVTVPYVEQLKSRRAVVFFAECQSSSFTKDVVVFPVGETRGSYLIIQDNSFDIGGGVIGIADGNWYAVDFFGGEETQKSQWRNAEYLLRTQPFVLLRPEQLDLIVTSKPERGCYTSGH